MSNIIPPTIAAALRPDSNSRQLIPGTRGARPSRFLATRTLGASLVAIVAMVLCASRASGQVPDTLWARSLDNQTISVCQNPTAPASISGCFGAASQIPMPVSSTNAINPVTDGTNVYIGDYRCPVADYGQNCIKTQIGWAGFTPDSIAAANGYLWLASSDSMSIYRCPSNLPFTNATSMPTECELLATPNVSPNSSKSLAVYALAYANGKLYVGITSSNGSEPSYLFSCDPNQTQDCAQLDMLEYKIDKIDDEYCYGGITSIAVGSGYVWVGLVHACDQHENRLLRCDPVALNSCQTWDTAGLPIVDVAHDGQGTVWAAVNYDQNLLEPRNKDDVVMSDDQRQQLHQRRHGRERLLRDRRGGPRVFFRRRRKLRSTDLLRRDPVPAKRRNDWPRRPGDSVRPRRGGCGAWWREGEHQSTSGEGRSRVRLAGHIAGYDPRKGASQDPHDKAVQPVRRSKLGSQTNAAL